MFKPHEVHDEHGRLEVDHQIYLQSPELRRRQTCSSLSHMPISFFRIE